MRKKHLSLNKWLDRYLKLKSKIEKSIKNGRFYQFNKQKQVHLLKRLKRYQKILQRKSKLATKLALVSAGIALATPTIGQNFTLVTGSANPFVDSTIDPNVPFGLLDVGTDSAPTFVDIDGDGDLDAFIGIDFGTINYFQNVGDSLNPSFTLNAAANPFSSVDVGSNASITLVDIDADEDFDAFIGESSGNIRYYENVGNINTPNFVLISSSFAFGISDIGSFAVPTFGDIDNDGDLDLFVGESNGNVNYFENMVVSQMRTMISIPELLLL